MIEDRIKHFKDKRGLSWLELCNIIGVSENGLKKMRANNSFKSETLDAIAKALEVKTSILLGPDEPPENLIQSNNSLTPKEYDLNDLFAPARLYIEEKNQQIASLSAIVEFLRRENAELRDMIFANKKEPTNILKSKS